MRKFLIAASLTVLCATPALASDDIMAGFYGNTVIASGGIGEFRTHYRADHTFDMVASMMLMSLNFKGTWALDGKGNNCRTYIGDAPPSTPNPQCTPVASHKVGDTWTVTSNGNTRTLTLKAGIQ